MVELRKNEHKTLLTVEKLGGKASVENVMEDSRLPIAAITRATLELQRKKLVKVLEKRQTLMRLSEEARLHAKEGLPERRLTDALAKLGKKASLEKTVEKAGLERRFVPIALGWIQRKRWATLDTKLNMLRMVRKPRVGEDEKLLKLLDEKEQATAESLSPELRATVQVLKRRKLLDVEEKTRRIVEMTETGWNAIREGIEVATETTQLTPELITSGRWRKTRFRKYDIKAPVAKAWPGKRHPYLQFLDEVKEELVALGFKEMSGPVVETSFFNFDALYTPQDHPAREIFGIYFIKQPKYGDLDQYMRVLQKVKKTHEHGWNTGSTGWRYRYSVKKAKRLVLRGHGTCLSVRTLIDSDLEIPGRYFSIARCYRPEVLDKEHLTEFNQVEGIVVDANLTLRDLLGVLERFAVEIAGADEVKFRPDYFPFTEPSVELNAYKQGYGWIECGGSGIFRPEVTLPLGIDVPVIAWGLGVDRLFMMKAGIEDIRDIFSQDLNWMRRKGVI